MNLLLLAIIGYLIGSIPFGYIAGRIHNIDLRQVGSGSTGGTNVFRALGLKWALASGMLDFLKGYVFLAGVDYFTNVSRTELWYLALFPMLGHIYPVWLRFKGGKGVSVAFGALTYFVGAPLALFVAVLWGLAIKVIKLMGLINLILFAVVPFFVFFTTRSAEQTVASCLIAALIWWAHRENIKRLRAGTENKLNI